MTALVNDLLDVSRITTGRIQLHPDRLFLQGIVQRAVEAAHPLIEQRRHDLTVSLPPQPIWVLADAARLEQVIVNLLNNAAKYTLEEGRIWLTVERANDDAEIRVRDTGVGIAPEILPRIFDLFTQAERTLDRSQGGLGIGLALVQRIVELHHGTVEAHSTPGQGSEFVVRLPSVSAPVSDSPLRSPETGARSSPSLRVLVVDDNVDSARTLAMLLQANGHQVESAYDGPTALETARSYRPNLILLDLGLPGMDGFEVAKRIRRQLELGDVVLVALTGYGQEADQHRSKEAGFDHHLVKPADFGKVKEILATVAQSAT